MSAALLCCLLVLWPSMAPSGAGMAPFLPMTGHSLFYRDHVMQRIGRLRIRQGLIKQIRKDVAGYTSAWNCGDIGKVAYISLNGGAVKRYQILDCSQPYHRAWHIRQRRVAEINESAVRRAGCVSRGGATMGRCKATLHAIRGN